MTTKSSTSKKSSGFFNKNSAYIDSLVSYILDTKPYHSKLSEIVEEYQFSEKMQVTFGEKMWWYGKFDSHWGYQHLSSANPNLRLTPINKLLTHLFQETTYQAGIDENHDLTEVPYAYSKRHFDGAGVAKVHLVRGTKRRTKIPMVESVDFCQSLGSFEFQVKQTYEEFGLNPDKTPNRVFNPLWQSTQDSSIIATAINTTIQEAMDEKNPRSSVNQIRGIITSLIDYIVVNKVDAKDVLAILQVEDNLLHGKDAKGDPLYNPNTNTLSGPRLPASYTKLFDTIKTTPALQGVPLFDIPILSGKLRELSPPLYFIPVTDRTMYETGKAFYRGISTKYLSVSDVVVDSSCAPQDWTLECVDVAKQTYDVIGKEVGFVGRFTAGKAFKPGRYISFTSKKLGKAPLTSTLTIAPINRISIADLPDAPRGSQDETWNLIKTNPIAHNRPIFGDREGKIYNAAGRAGYVDLISPLVPTSIYTIEYDGNNIFDVTTTSDPAYAKTVMVDEVFNDGFISFTIKAGDIPFIPGDRFLVDILNELPYVEDLDIHLGYDVEAFDNDHLVDDLNRVVGFYFSSRYGDLNLKDTMDINVSEYVADNRKWRLETIPNKDKPINTLKKDGTGPNNSVDWYDATSGIAPDPASDSPAVYTENPDGSPDIQLYYSDKFRFSYSDDDFVTSTFVAEINIGDYYSNKELGVAFNTPPHPLEKPFIGGTSRVYNETVTHVDFGDIIAFTTRNGLRQVNEPIILFSDYIPRLNPHSSGFYYAPEAVWTVTMLSPTEYSIMAFHASGLRNGKVVKGYPRYGSFKLNGEGIYEGLSYKDEYIHFSIEVGCGFKAGDTFKFDTYDRKPTYLVHGSESGYMPPAVVGETYWNGLIGFKINKPSYYITDGTSCADNKDITSCVGYGRVWAGDDLEVFNKFLKVNRIRIDHETTNYIISRNGNNGYIISRSEEGIIGRINYGGGIFETDQIEIEIIGNGIDDYFGEDNKIVISVAADGLQVFNSRDLVLMNSDLYVLNPTGTDELIVTKTLDSRMEFNITPGTAPIADLWPQYINAKDIDINTNTPEGLRGTSPEALILNGWIPTSSVKWDSTTSIAEFYDQANTNQYFTIGTGEYMGKTVELLDSNNHPRPYFEWDVDFIMNHLPTNAEVNIVTNNQGWRDKVSVSMKESSKFISDSKGPLQNYGMSDAAVNVKIYEKKFTYIDASYNGSASAIVDDSFGGFTPGFGNMLFDAEIPVFKKNGDINESKSKGFYDMASPISLDSLLKRFGTTPANIKTITNMWDFYLKETGKIPVTMEDWEWVREKLKVDIPNALTLAPEFGIPFKGAGFDMDSEETGVTEPEINDYSEILDIPLPDSVGFSGTGMSELTFDDDGDIILHVATYKEPSAKPAYVSGMDWDSFTGFYDSGTRFIVDNGVTTEVDVGANRIVLSLPNKNVQEMNVDIWYADDKNGKPSRANPEKITDQLYNITIPRLVRVKLDVYR